MVGTDRGEFDGGRVVIVGAGVIGCSLAFHLALYGQTDVTVLDAGAVGEGSTAKATGGIRQQFSSEINADIAHEAVDYYTHFADRVGEPFDFRQHGYLFLLSENQQREQFEHNAIMQRRLGINVDILENDDLTELVPGVNTADLIGGAYTPSDGSGSPSDAAAAFARQARRRGVRFVENDPVVDIQQDADSATLTAITKGSRYRASLILNAAGPWSAQLATMVGLDIPVEPHPRQAFGVGPMAQLSSGMPMTIDLASGSYVHPESSGGIVGGNDRNAAASWDIGVRWELTESLITALVYRFPWMMEARVQEGWCGLREMTPDDHAIIGPTTQVPGWWNVCGFSGHGFMQAPVIGDHVARWLLGRSDARDLSPFRLSRFAEGAAAQESTVF